jgi:hypothetical protein
VEGGERLGGLPSVCAARVLQLTGCEHRETRIKTAPIRIISTD